MIDPKLNDLPVEGAPQRSKTGAGTQTEGQGTEREQKGRAGLSINDTVAANANMSVGGRGVAVSGVEAGSGAGAGTTMSTPVTSGQSPAPTIAPGPRGSGTTALGSSNAEPESTTLPSGVQTGGTDVTDDEIAVRAYCSWCDRGRPHGSPEVDWERAAEELRRERSGKARAASV